MTVKDNTLADKAKEATDRVGEVLAEYKRMKGVAEALIGEGTHDLFASLMADLFHYASFIGIDANLAIADGYRMHVEERE